MFKTKKVRQPEQQAKDDGRLDAMRKNVLPLICLAVCASWLGYVAYSSASKQSPEAASILPAPNFTWQAFDGTSHTLNELNGHAVVIHFWASWCTPCRAEFPNLIKAAEHTGSKVIFLTVSSDSSLDKAKDFLATIHKETGATIPDNMLLAFDPQKSLTFDVFQTIQYPETILLDSTHHMRMKFSGMADWNSPKMNTYLQQLLEPIP